MDNQEFQNLVDEIYQRKMREMAEAVADKMLRDTVKGVSTSPVHNFNPSDVVRVVGVRAKNKRRYPYNALVMVNLNTTKKIKSSTKLYGTWMRIKELLANGPARRHDITGVLRETDPHIVKHITMLLDYKLLKVVS